MNDDNYNILPRRKDEGNSAGNIDTKEMFTRRKFRRAQCPMREAACWGRNKRGKGRIVVL
jgi:hypothetical protein